MQDKWLQQLSTCGYVQIHNFLAETEALRFRKKILNASHFKTWSLLTSPSYPFGAIKDNITSDRIDDKKHSQAVSAYRRRQFSFSFYRSSNKHKKVHKCTPINQLFTCYLQRKICPELGLSGAIRDVFFASFVKGQFIAYHTDGKAGQYGFIYQLSKGWQPKYGGQLELYPRKGRFYKTILQPTFNTLTLLKLDHPMPHSVRMLNNPKHKHRLTISGWLE